MGWWSGIRLAEQVAADTPAAGLPRLQLGTWEDTSALDQLVVLADLFDLDHWPMSRGEAMRVPAMARTRHVLCGGIAQFGLVTDTGGEPPIWANRQDDPLPPYHRMVSTVDDLLFHGVSLWQATRGTDGFPYRLSWVSFDRWDYDPDSTRILIDGDEATPQADLVLVPGPHEGILTFGARVIRAGTALEVTAGDTAARPFRVELHNTTDVDLDDDEIGKLIGRARQALADNNGILYTSRGLEARVHPVTAEQLLIAGRESIGTQIAQLAGVPAAAIDAGGGSAGSSITYANLNTRFRELLAFGLGYYMAAISGRLSQDDVTPRGTRVVFSVEDTARRLIGPENMDQETPG